MRRNLVRHALLIVVASLVLFDSLAFARLAIRSVAEKVGSAFLLSQKKAEKVGLKERDTRVQYASDYSISDISELKDEETGELLAFIIALEPKGFIVLSSDTDLTPIIAYSLEGDFDLVHTKDNITTDMVIQDMRKRKKAIPIISQERKHGNNELWRKYFYEDETLLAEVARAEQFGPLLPSPTWHQRSPYNDYCPFNNPYTPTERFLVGCVATAMAQIVNFHKYPSSVTFTSSESYTCGCVGDYTCYTYVDAPQASILSIVYPATLDTAARLSFACGVSVRMQYEYSGSSARTEDVAVALLNKFGYQFASVNWSPWDNGFRVALQTDMQNERPAQLAIERSTDGVGHSIVCDGWQTDTGLYHLNYGWGNVPSSTNWWYSLPTGMPADFNILKYGILGISPFRKDGAYIDPSGSCDGNKPCFKTIQEGINAASTISTIKVMEGTYNEKILLNEPKDLALEGGWDLTFSSQKPMKTKIKAPSVTDGSLTLYNLIVIP